MEKAIKLLSLVDDLSFIDLYYVGSKPASDVFTIDSIIFLSRDDAQNQCDYKNRIENTSIYRVFRTCVHI